MRDINLHAELHDEGGPLDKGARLRDAGRAATLAETLQRGRYSAVTQAAVVLVLAVMFWNIVLQAYLVGLTATVTAAMAVQKRARARRVRFDPA